MNLQQNYFDFSYKETAMTSQFRFQKSVVKTEEIENVSTVRSKKFSFLWTINNFKEFMDRQYEFMSPLFFGNLSSCTSKWRMIIHPENIYPEGIHVALRLVLLSEVDKSYSVLNTIYFIDNSGKQHKLKTREKVFRRSLDFDECPIISNVGIKNKDLLTGESLVIKCEFDLLECENQDDMHSKRCGNLDILASKSSEVSGYGTTNYQNEKVNIPSNIQSMNDLSYTELYKKSSDSEKIVNASIEKDSLPETDSVKSEIPNCKIKEGLEILSNDLKHLYYSTNQHDIVIYVDDGKLTAHEIILTSRSDYFKNALLLQKNKEINVSGINVETLDAVLYYLYTGKLNQITEDSAIDLIKASKLLGLPSLENLTTETCLSSRIRASNVTNIFLMAKELKIESLKNSALKFMAENREEVIKTEPWNELMRNDPHSAGEILLTTAYYQNKLVNNA